MVLVKVVSVLSTEWSSDVHSWGFGGRNLFTCKLIENDQDAIWGQNTDFLLDAPYGTIIYTITDWIIKNVLSFFYWFGWQFDNIGGLLNVVFFGFIEIYNIVR